jgi:predicted ribosome quality control (RQC) complex YloA/Tae2 family protein
VHNSYYFLQLIARRLNTRLKGFRLVSCFSQSRDELLIEFHKGVDHFFIRASLLPELASVSFPSGIKRARKNSIDLFPELVLREVVSAQSYENDRSFRINLEGGHGVLFKMHGNRSNVLHTIDERVTAVFRNNIASDLDLIPETLARKIDWDSLSPAQRGDIFTFSKEVWSYLDEQGFASHSTSEQHKMLVAVRKKLESATEFFHIEHGQSLEFSLLPYKTIAARFDDPFLAVTAFVVAYSSRLAFQYEKTRLVRQLRADVAKAESYLKKTRDHLVSLTADQQFQQWGDLLMANLDNIPPGAKTVTLANFYDNDSPAQIKLNPTLTPQKNAEAYYRKAKNRSIELTKNRELLIAKEMELLKLNQVLSKVEVSHSLKEIRDHADADDVNDESPKTRMPYREVQYGGFRIWVGKDAKDNDELTLRYGHKEDLWLHTKDAAGSHVLIKHQAGKVFPKDVIERAAQLAAFYSKRKTESLCPVAYTPKKYVRKRKGDPAGMVVVEREKVLLVEPRGI